MFKVVATRLLVFMVIFGMALSVSAAPTQEEVPIAVQVLAPEFPAAPGEPFEFSMFVENITTDTTVTVRPVAEIVYADGTRQRFGLSGREGFTLEPGIGVGINLIFLVPEDVAPGTATLTGTARVTKLQGGTKGKYKQPIVVVDSATFEVVEPSGGTSEQ